MNMRRIAAGLSAAAIALSLTGCGSDSGDKKAGDGDTSPTGDNTSAAEVKTITNGTLTVCSDVPYPPFEDFDKSAPSGFKGFDVDIISSIASDLGLKLVIKDSSFDALQSGLALKGGQCDLVASAMTITPEREKNLSFSTPYYDSEQSLLVKDGSDITSIEDLDGKKVGVQKGTTGQKYTEENAKGAKIVVFPSDGEMWPALRGGSVEALLQDLPVNLEHTKDGGYTIVQTYKTDESYGLAMQKDSPLVATVNEALQSLRDSGEYQKIYDTYFATN